VSQVAYRMVPNQYTYRPYQAKICLAKLEGDEMKFIGGQSGSGKDDIVFQSDLVAGDYFVFSEVDFDGRVPINHYVLSSYSPANLNFEKGYFADFLEKALSSEAQQNPNKTSYAAQGQDQIYMTTGMSESGYGYVYYHNGSSTTTLNETVTFTTFEGLELQHPYEGV